MAPAADNEASMKLRRRPIERMSMLAGIVVEATLTTMIDIGRVARDGFPESLAPIMPPRVTITMEPVADIS
jgi:hypothetical protein